MERCTQQGSEFHSPRTSSNICIWYPFLALRWSERSIVHSIHICSYSYMQSSRGIESPSMGMQRLSIQTTGIRVHHFFFHHVKHFVKFPFLEAAESSCWIRATAANIKGPSQVLARRPPDIA